MILITYKTSQTLLHKSCPPAFPVSQFLGSGLIPRSWEGGKAGGQDLCNKADVAPRHLVERPIATPSGLHLEPRPNPAYHLEVYRRFSLLKWQRARLFCLLNPSWRSERHDIDQKAFHCVES
jgi:hypothetical protein